MADEAAGAVREDDTAAVPELLSLTAVSLARSKSGFAKRAQSSVSFSRGRSRSRQPKITSPSAIAASAGGASILASMGSTVAFGMIALIARSATAIFVVCAATSASTAPISLFMLESVTMSKSTSR